MVLRHYEAISLSKMAHAFPAVTNAVLFPHGRGGRGVQRVDVEGRNT